VKARAVVEQLIQNIGPLQNALQSRQLSDVEFDACLEIIAAAPRSAMPVSLLLTQMQVVRSWKFQQRPDASPPTSWLLDHYGHSQRLSTFLAFSSVDEYRWVKATIFRTIGIELIDKYVKPRSAQALL
jgi:hypothetical protein